MRAPPLSKGKQTVTPVPAASATQRVAAAAAPAPAARHAIPASVPVALPAPLRKGIEALSGIAMGDVRVHRGSAGPRRIGALAYARGSDIHLAPGQDRHLPHEAWHIVQQKQRRVRATGRIGDTAINGDAALEREADAMGARAAAYRGTPRKAAEPAPVVPDVAQCAGNVRFANVSGDPTYVSKAAAIVAGLRATRSIHDFLQDKDALITLEDNPHLASVLVVGDQVQISLAPWFFEQESRGRILGMLAHEFGVHPLARQAMTQVERTQEDTDHANATPFPTGIADHTITSAAAGQRDHVFAAVAGQPRFDAYRDTVYEMATSLVRTAHAAHPGGVTEAHVTDLMMTYLADLAMILATNDHRAHILIHPGRTAQAFNLERARWVAWVGARHPQTADDAALVRLTPPDQETGDVLNQARSLAGSRLLAPLHFWKTTTTDVDMRHRPQGGGVAPANRNQENVLADHGLQLVPMAHNGGGLLDAIDAVAGPNWRQAALQRIAGQHALDADDQAAMRIINRNSDVRTLVTRGIVNTLGWAMQRDLRVLEPTGRMLQPQPDEPYGAFLTLVWVREPAPHYRAAQPAPPVLPPIVHPPVQNPVQNPPDNAAPVAQPPPGNPEP